MGWQDKPLWCIGGDGAMFDIGFQSLSRMFASGMNIKVFVLDTQVYSNTGGQASTSQLHRPEHQDERARQGDRRQAGAPQGDRPDRHDAPADVRRPDDLRPHQPLLQVGARRAGVRRPGASSAATRPASPSTAWPTTWPTDQARLAVDTRAFPLLIYDPRKGDTIRERLSLQGNPAVNDDWWTNPKTGEEVDFIDFARSEGRFGKHFDKDGNPSETLLRAKQDRLENWHAAAGTGGRAGEEEGRSRPSP